MRFCTHMLLLLTMFPASASAQETFPGADGKPLHPRDFASPGKIGPSRGWFVWHSFDKETWEAVISRDPPGETWKVKVLPWATTYRYLTYGVRPEELLAGERINLFLGPSPERKHAYVCHFQDELSQMKGHNHVWKVRSIGKNGETFTASLYMGNERKLEEEARSFRLLPGARKWRGGKQVEDLALQENESVYMTWCYKGDQRLVQLLADDASLAALQKQNQARVAEEVAKIGLAGVVEKIDGADVQFTVFSTYWFQARDFKPEMEIRLRQTSKGCLPIGEGVKASLVSIKAGGPYGSGPVAVALKLKTGADATRLSEWGADHVLRLSALK